MEKSERFRKISNFISFIAIIPVVLMLKKAGDGILYYDGIAVSENIHNIYIKFLPIGLAVLLIAAILFKTKIGKVAYHIAVFILFGTLLSWTYMYNIMDVDNYTFEAFQHDSEILVTKGLEREAEGFSLLEDDNSSYGLRSTDANLGIVGEDNIGNPETPRWKNGYSTLKCGMVVKNTEEMREIAIPGAYMRNVHAPYTVSDVQMDDDYIYIYFDSDIILTEEYEGPAKGAEFLRYIAAYKSQYGLQGKVFRKYAENFDTLEDASVNMRFINSSMMAAVVMLIVIMIYHKYDIMMAGSFYITFLLSQWVTNFARNLYWVEFMWFIPMAIGIFCSLYSEKRIARVISYIGAFLSILIKSLCGYEYLSTVMMGLIAFLMADIVSSVTHKDKEKTILLMKTTINIGIFALAGFVVAICMHADLRGGGNIAEGIKIIIEQDVMRRTHSVDVSAFSEDTQISLQSTVKEVVERYFEFETPVILGIESDRFSFIYKIALLLGVAGIAVKRRRVDDIVLYFVFLLSTLSWYVLAKAHSYVHPHMNYVLWYFGFIQICIYLIVSAIPNVIIYHQHKKRNNNSATVKQ